MNVLLSGIVGSTAYGLAHEGSDVDRLGLFAAPTRELLGLRGPRESYVTTAPDRTMHEAAKWCRLALAGNPTVMELVWLPDELYETRTALGDELIGIRGALLSARRVRDAYLGYAAQQFRRLAHGAPGRRAEKHARHLVRLLEQGEGLHRTGRLAIRLEDPERVRAAGARIAAEPARAEALLAASAARFDGPGALPAEPDEAAVEAWLLRVRDRHYGPHGLAGDHAEDGAAASARA